MNSIVKKIGLSLLVVPVGASSLQAITFTDIMNGIKNRSTRAYTATKNALSSAATRAGTALVSAKGFTKAQATEHPYRTALIAAATTAATSYGIYKGVQYYQAKKQEALKAADKEKQAPVWMQKFNDFSELMAVGIENKSIVLTEALKTAIEYCVDTNSPQPLYNAIFISKTVVLPQEYKDLFEGVYNLYRLDMQAAAQQAKNTPAQDAQQPQQPQQQQDWHDLLITFIANAYKIKDKWTVEQQRAFDKIIDQVYAMNSPLPLLEAINTKKMKVSPESNKVVNSMVQLYNQTKTK